MIKEFRNQAAVLAGLERSLNAHFGRIYGLVEVTTLDKRTGGTLSVMIVRLSADFITQFGARVGDDIVVLNIDKLLDLEEDIYMNLEDLNVMVKILEDGGSI